MSTTESTPLVEPLLDKPLRADAQRNREQLISVAGRAFAERGVDTSLEEIAKQAGVGIGTLYRHFPTRHALIEAVYRQEVEVLCGGVDELLATLPADQALDEWMQRFIGYVAIKRGLMSALKEVVAADSEVFARSRAQMNEAVAKLVGAAVAAGAIRADAEPADLLRGLSGFCMFGDQEDGWQGRALRLSRLLVDGLRYGAPQP
jgi:AcrR family transcriptional regulator